MAYNVQPLQVRRRCTIEDQAAQIVPEIAALDTISELVVLIQVYRCKDIVSNGHAGLRRTYHVHEGSASFDALKDRRIG